MATAIISSAPGARPPLTSPTPKRCSATSASARTSSSAPPAFSCIAPSVISAASTSSGLGCPPVLREAERLGDVNTQRNLESGPMMLIALADDDCDRAQTFVDAAQAKLDGPRFHLQHY